MRIGISLTIFYNYFFLSVLLRIFTHMNSESTKRHPHLLILKIGGKLENDEKHLNQIEWDLFSLRGKGFEKT